MYVDGRIRADQLSDQVNDQVSDQVSGQVGDQDSKIKSLDGRLGKDDTTTKRHREDSNEKADPRRHDAVAWSRRSCTAK